MGEWLFADSGRRQPEKSGDPNLALQESLLASLNLPGPLPQIQAATTPIQADADASLKKLDALPAGYFSPGLLREACKTPQSAAALVEKQNTALTSREGRAQYASFLESARDDAELGKLYSLVHQSLSPEQEAEHLKLVAKDPQVSAAQLGVVDAGLFKKAASNPLLGTALAEVQASALKTESGVNALLTLTQAASATPEGAADLYASRASAAQSEPGRKALEGLYAGIASQAKLVQAQASLEVQALTTEPGRQAVVMERTQAAQSPQLCAQLVRLESKTQSLPQSNQIATAISNQSELAGASLAVSAAAAQTPAGLSQLAEVFQKVAQDPQKASLWAKTQSLALQNPAGQADFIQLHKNLRQDKTAATAYTNALTAAGVEELTGLLGAAARNPQTSSLLLSTANQAPTCSVQELVIKSSASPTEMGNLLSSALEAEGGVSQIGKLMQAVSESPAASSAAIRALNAGPTQSLVIKLAENAPAAAATTAALATATQSREGRTEVAQLLAKTSKDEGLSQATLHLLNAGKPEDVRTFLTGASLEPKAAAELGKTMVVASRKSEGVEEVTKLLQVASATPEAAR
ncbi:hypothetical protein JST97_18605, partial [bacterium]|nr:hypothetical protein [bacterium]